MTLAIEPIQRKITGSAAQSTMHFGIGGKLNGTAADEKIAPTENALGRDARRAHKKKKKKRGRRPFGHISIQEINNRIIT